ncbi:hypothetical protein PRIPAC_71498 [Pristionchus pacificus]|uniref:Uncharacterized protein n=1 Tax=Pristionchus pacificus TaxID=54126 RepID=A0A2A6C7S5_PRIPA|nr:hypothetical protein PRIPAC_71498 [Pristionchus pacificus]|eukprot:PDM74234.1 hypothetical protein PRIPAC_41590 [Pristionchus pacificus]
MPELGSPSLHFTCSLTGQRGERVCEMKRRRPVLRTLICTTQHNAFVSLTAGANKPPHFDPFADSPPPCWFGTNKPGWNEYVPRRGSFDLTETKCCKE